MATVGVKGLRWNEGLSVSVCLSPILTLDLHSAQGAAVVVAGQLQRHFILATVSRDAAVSC